MGLIKYPSLNGLRAISIIMVIGNHLYAQLLDTPVLGIAIVSFPILVDGKLGVNLFFIISGFLITQILQNEELKTKAISLKRFFARRILRIFPAYYFLFLVYLVLWYFGYVHLKYVSLITLATYTKAFYWNLDWVTAHTWSLSIEEIFYVVWPFILLIGRRFRIWFLFAILFLCPVLRVFSREMPEYWRQLALIFGRTDAIALGCLLAIYFDRIRAFVRLYVNWLITFALLLLIGLPLVGSLDFSKPLIEFTGPSFWWLDSLNNLALVTFLVYSVAHSKSLWFRFLNSKILEKIGVLSYSLYLWQQLFTSDLAVGKVLYPYNLILIVIAALLSYYLIERPFLRIKEKYFK